MGAMLRTEARGRSLRHAAMAVLAATLAGCSQVMETTVHGYVAEAPAGAPVNCHSSLGAYFLPKSFVHVVVEQYTDPTTGELIGNTMTTLETVVRADSRRAFCLDYLASVAASDQVWVKKTSYSATAKHGSQLLESIASHAIDQSAIILRRIIQATFIGISGFRTARVARDNAKKAIVADFEFDPFDQTQSAYVNDRLRDFGFCLVLEFYTYGQPAALAGRYCADPQRYIARETALGRAYAEFSTGLIAPRTPGIVYRPRTTFQLSVFAKNDPKGTDPWQQRKTMPVLLENISPILSVGVDRALFTKKQIALVFDKGALEKVCIIKGSEAVEAIKIPLEVVKAIAKLPTDIAQIQYDNISKSVQLAQVERQLIASQEALLAAQTSTAQPQVPNESPALPDAFDVSVTPIQPTYSPLEAAAFRAIVSDCKKDDGTG